MESIIGRIDSEEKTKDEGSKAICNSPVGTEDYDNIGKCVQETLEESMTVIVILKNEMKSVLDMRIVELKTLLEQIAQILTTTTTTSGTLRGEQARFIEVDLASISTNTL